MNIAGTAISLLTNAYVARVLGPERLGIIAIITGINASVLAVLDVRLHDVAGRLYFQADAYKEEAKAFQAGILWISLIGIGAVSVVMAIISSLIGFFVIHYFTSTPVDGWWIFVGATSAALNATAGSALFLMRLTKEVYALGRWRLISAIVSAAATAWWLHQRPDVGGFYIATIIASCLLFVVSGFAWFDILKIKHHIPILKPRWKSAYSAYRDNRALVWYGNLLSYAKLLQRSADVLVVGYFATDRQTGLYQFARQTIDQGLAIFQEAFHQVYYPLLLESFTQSAKDRFRYYARRLFRIATLLTAAMLLGEAILFPYLIQKVFGVGYVQAKAPMMILTATFIYLIGFYPWQSAVFIGAGRLKDFTRISFGSTAAQYAVIFALFAVFSPSATVAMIGMGILNLSLALWASVWVYREYPDYFPWGQKA